MSARRFDLLALVTRATCRPLRTAMFVLAALLALALVARLMASTSRVAALEFRTTFDGVERGSYPNGVPFSGEECVTERILRDVYTKRKLERLGPFDVFRTAFAVVRDNPELRVLDAEYMPRLADTRLALVDRSSVEDEYRKRRASLAAQARYTLLWREPVGLQPMGDSELQSLLRDVLGGWQYHIRTNKRATSYNLPVLTQNVLQGALIEAEEYVVAVVVLRAKIDRFVAMVDQLVKLPGAGTFRGGPRRLSLVELRAQLQDLQRFEVTPLSVLARTNGLVRDPMRLRAFIASRKQQAGWDMLEATARVAALQQATLDYNSQGWQGRGEGQSAANPLLPRQGGSRTGAADDVTAIIPQFGDTFFTRLAETASKSSDVAYRQKVTDRVITEQEKLVDLHREQAYFEDLERTLAGARTSPPLADAQRAFDHRFARTLAAVKEKIDEIGAIYAELSAKNLDPLQNLYSITRDVTIRTESALVLWRLVLLALLASGGVYAVLEWTRRRLPVRK